MNRIEDYKEIKNELRKTFDEIIEIEDLFEDIPKSLSDAEKHIKEALNIIETIYYQSDDENEYIGEENEK